MGSIHTIAAAHHSKDQAVTTPPMRSVLGKMTMSGTVEKSNSFLLLAYVKSLLLVSDAGTTCFRRGRSARMLCAAADDIDLVKT